MKITADILIVFVALLHVTFLVLEMFLWTTPTGLRIFAQSLDQAKASEKLAANQGLYNGFLAAGLLWAILEPTDEFSKSIRIFFLSCVILAGLYGARTVHVKILFVQAMPALLALLLTLVS